MTETNLERKYSIYFAIVGAVVLAGLSMYLNGTIEPVNAIITELMLFAGIRQGLKSFLQK